MKVLSVDDHRLFAEGLRNLLGDFVRPEDFKVCFSCEEAFALADLDDYGIVLLDYKLEPGGLVGMEALVEFRERCPAARIVVVSGEKRADEIRRMIDNGAVGFIPKAATFDVLQAALNLVLAGGIYLPPEALDEVADPRLGDEGPSLKHRIDGLTQRPKDVLKIMVQGKSNKQIANELNISVHTVKAHASKVFSALEVSGRTEAIYVVAKLGLDWLMLLDKPDDSEPD
jgi:DNA-binding NarL/FixJ family response regulator